MIEAIVDRTVETICLIKKIYDFQKRLQNLKYDYL
jgi:hypothetical protein